MKWEGQSDAKIKQTAFIRNAPTRVTKNGTSDNKGIMMFA